MSRTPIRILISRPILSTVSLSVLDRIRQPRRPARRQVAQRVRPRPISIVSRIDGSKKCSICMGVIKRELTSVDCTCGSSFHNSCAIRVGVCPICRSEIEIPVQTRGSRTEINLEPIKSMPLSREDRLFLLEDRLLSGEIDQETYEKLKKEIGSSMPEPVYCANCGGKLYPGEKCDCIDRPVPQCPECGKGISEGDQFCRSCGVIFSDDFKEELFQCSACGRIVSASERICTCGAALLDPGDSVCTKCGHPVPLFSPKCPNCGQVRVIETLECPSCGREVGQDDFECDCGAIFEDRIGRIECPECTSEVGIDDKFCKSCGVQFQKDGFSSSQKTK